MRSLGLRVRAWIGLITFLGSLALPIASPRHLTFDDDAACAPAEITAVHAQTQVGAATKTPAPGHCPLCHWLRAVGGATVGAGAVALAWLEPQELQVAQATTSPTTTIVAHRPS